MSALAEAARWRRNHEVAARTQVFLDVLELALVELRTPADEAQLYLILGAGRSEGIIERLTYEYRHPRVTVMLWLSGAPWIYRRSVTMP